MTRTMIRISCATLVAVLSLLAADFAAAHHILGRPSYSLNEDSNTPPAVQGEAEAVGLYGGFVVTYMVYPAFPRPGEPGRVNVYIKNHNDKAPYQGTVTFKIRDGSQFSWLWGEDHQTTLGTQPPDDNIHRQGFVFPDEGEYIISASFEDGGQPYNVEFPLRVGAPAPMGYVFGIALFALLVFTLVQRRRSMTGKMRSLHADGGNA